MTFDEFSDKLKEIKADFRKAYGRDMETLKDLEAYLVRRKFAKSGGKTLKSLKGFSF